MRRTTRNGGNRRKRNRRKEGKVKGDEENKIKGGKKMKEEGKKEGKEGGKKERNNKKKGIEKIKSCDRDRTCARSTEVNLERLQARLQILVKNCSYKLPSKQVVIQKWEHPLNFF